MVEITWFKFNCLALEAIEFFTFDTDEGGFFEAKAFPTYVFGFIIANIKQEMFFLTIDCPCSFFICSDLSKSNFTSLANDQSTNFILKIDAILTGTIHAIERFLHL